MDRQRERIIEESKRYWVRLYVKLGMKGRTEQTGCQSVLWQPSGMRNGVIMSMGEGEEGFSTVFHQRKQNRLTRQPLEVLQ